MPAGRTERHPQGGGSDGIEQELANGENDDGEREAAKDREHIAIAMVEQPECAPGADGKWQRIGGKPEHQPQKEQADEGRKDDQHGRPFETRLPPPPQRDCAGPT
ncbi:hypothetical protein NEE01_15830 [Sphingomonas sp. MMSM24]|uniref:Uncharacterized protein n=2 Tax=Sphingomonas lycopersici TaxID=2951807 RepID=A0AA41ZAY3_9SPHN|nr:hypothetical protein [Sphingomonas lycopersici]